MPTFGGLLKKKRTKDPADPSAAQSESTANSASSEGLKSVPTASSQTSNSLHRPDTATSSTQQPIGDKTFQQNVDVAQQQPSTVAPSTSEPPPSQVDGASNMASNSASQQAGPQLRQTKGKYTLPDFTISRTLGTGSFGRVHLVQSKHNQRFYAVKVLKKAQVVKMKQVEHTNDERKMLQQVKHPFLITLWGTFQDSKNLYMVMDFVEGGELFSLLRKSQVSLCLPHPSIARFESY